MIRHIVLFKFLPGTTSGARREAIAALQALPSFIPEIRSWSVGEQARVASTTFHLAEVGVFETFGALDAFRIHPARRAVLNLLAPIAVCHTIDYLYDPKEEVFHG